MKNCFILIISFLFIGQYKADTITYWHVYLNKLKIQEFNQFTELSEHVIKIDETSFIEKDSIQIRLNYCSLFLSTSSFEILDSLKNKVAEVFVSTTKLNYPIQKLVEYKKRTGQSTFLFKHNFKPNNREMTTLLFYVKLE